MFDGTEALPSCLANEYQTLLEADPLRASELLIPMPWWQVAQLRRQGKVRGGRAGEPFVVDLPYNSETGTRAEANVSRTAPVSDLTADVLPKPWGDTAAAAQPGQAEDRFHQPRHPVSPRAGANGRAECVAGTRQSVFRSQGSMVCYRLPTTDDRLRLMAIRSAQALDAETSSV